MGQEKSYHLKATHRAFRVGYDAIPEWFIKLIENGTATTWRDLANNLVKIEYKSFSVTNVALKGSWIVETNKECCIYKTYNNDEFKEIYYCDDEHINK